MKLKVRPVMKSRWHVAESYDTAPRIDEQEGVIYNVLILGRKHRNKRHYTEEAMEDAVNRGTYDGLQVYIGPHKKTRFAKRSPHDHAGELRNITLAQDGLRGDLHYNRASRGGKLVLEIAKRFPKRFGLSHHADVAGYEENGEKYITRILEATVADVIKDPATTDGVYEDVETPKTKSAKQVREEAAEEGDTGLELDAGSDTDEGSGGWASCLKQLIGELHDDDSIDDDVKMKATKQLMKVKKLLNGEDESSADDSDSDADEGDAEEAVDVAKLVRREFKRLSKQLVQNATPQRKSGIKPRSTARVNATEDVTPTPKPKLVDKLPPLKKREDIVAAYSDEE